MTTTAHEGHHNPRYLAYCASNGNSPAAQLEADRVRWPGGCMYGFTAWIAENLPRFRAARPDAFLGNNVTDQDAWTEFLIAQS